MSIFCQGKHCTLAIFFMIVAASFQLNAAVPSLLSYQGKLSNQFGNPLTGTFSLTFTLYNSEIGGSAIWSETNAAVNVTNGLYSVLLGSISPIDHNRFSGTDRFLGVRIGNDPDMSPRQRIVSVAYAQRIATLDGASGGTINGSIHATDTLTAQHFKLGSSSASGKLRVFGDGSSSPIIVAQENSEGGGDLRLYDQSAAMTHAFYKDVSDGGGGLLHVSRNDLGQAGFTVDGNYSGSGSPRISIVGENRSATLDMSSSGDQSIALPPGSISAMEMANEAGAASSMVTASGLGLDATIQTLLSRAVDVPSDGYAFVIATFELTINHSAGTAENLHFGISTTAGSFPSNQHYDKVIQTNAATGSITETLTLHSFFTIDSGPETFYLLGRKNSGGAVTVDDAVLSILFVPTWYGSVLTVGELETNSSDPQ